jgi:L-ascorbate metabolism protein UlaG (beta-lactamase superfamily)
MLDRFTWFKQAAYRWDGDGLTVYIDPWGIPDNAPPADVVLITHAHFDHFDLDDVGKITKDDTSFVAPRDVADELSGDVHAVKPGDTVDVRGVKGETVPAYNVLEGREDNHPKAKGWVGYVIDLGGIRYYHAGDTDHVPELEQVTAQVSFLPIGGAGFTMDGREAAGLAKAISPEIAVPMHYGYVEGCHASDETDVFRAEAQPVRVETLQPVVPFEF